MHSRARNFADTQINAFISCTMQDRKIVCFMIVEPEFVTYHLDPLDHQSKNVLTTN